MPTSPVLIIGGGLAGISAAAGLISQGLPCRILEARHKLGGRASSFDDPTSGEELDNCQHVSMGCCTNLAHLCETTGVSTHFRREQELTFIGPTGRASTLSASLLPAPMHLLPSLAAFHWLTWSERIELLRGLFALLRTPRRHLLGVRMSDWLDQMKQSERVRRGFWHLILVSALSETLDRIDASYARKVLLDGFGRNRTGWQVLVPTVSLNTLYDEMIAGWLVRQGVQIDRSSSVEQIHCVGGRVAGLVTRDGETIHADDVIAAVPPNRLAPLLQEAGVELSTLPDLSALETAPIASVHLWFDHPLTTWPHAVLVDRLSQWVFKRTEASHTLPDAWYCQVVISASRDVEQLGSQATISQVVADLQACFPATREARLLRSRLVVERRAVFSATPGVDVYRPVQNSPISNLQLAGDWTQTGWPATMESAVRSGYLAAENVLKRQGRTVTLLQPDLPSVWLSRILFPE